MNYGFVEGVVPMVDNLKIETTNMLDALSRLEASFSKLEKIQPKVSFFSGHTQENGEEGRLRLLLSEMEHKKAETETRCADLIQRLQEIEAAQLSSHSEKERSQDIDPQSIQEKLTEALIRVDHVLLLLGKKI